jgi:FkbM family methyltransferase
MFAPIEALLGGARLQIIDVGARGGLNERWQPFGQFVEMVGFEPDEVECKRLAESDQTGGRVRFLPYALGGGRARRTFHMCQQPRCSSLYPPNEAFAASFAAGIADSMRLVRTIEMDVQPLDEIAAAEGLRPDCLKIDVQGAELEVLQGGERMLGSVKLVELEVEFNPQYVGQPLFGEIDTYMRTQGFALLGLRRTLWRRRAAIGPGLSVAGGQIVHGDVLYINERRLGAGPTDRVELAKWLLLLSAYRQHDYVLELLDRSPAAAALPAETRQALAASLTTPPRPGARTLGALLRPLVRGVEHGSLRQWLDASRSPAADDWHDPDFF